MRLYRHRHFSLVELLVVTNVIVILVAMLVPAVVKSRENAKRVKCMSTLKQHMAVHMQWK